MWIRLFQALVLAIMTSPLETYNIICPERLQRAFRGHSFCSGSTRNYSCLFDTNEQHFMEYCDINPDFSAPGEYYVFTGRRRNIECEKSTYQPYSLWSNEGSRCTFLKSPCTERGQILYKLGSATRGSQCRCDYSKQYDFVIRPKNHCFCIPSEEDCTCYIKQCGFGYILNADYKCKIHQQRSEAMCEDIKDIDIGIKGENRTKTNNSYYPITDLNSERKSLQTGLSIMIVIACSGLCGIVCAMINYQILDQSGCSRTITIDDLIGYLGSSSIEQDQHIQDRSITRNLDDFGDFKVVAAIDIGSTSSWYGSSTVDKFKTNPLNIRVDKSWLDCDSFYLPVKTATCILLDMDGNFISLGHRAQWEYAELLLDGKADCCLFFDKFKMKLYNNETISDCMLIKDVKGREMKAIVVFSSFISELMKRVKNSYQGIEFDDIQWVLTVPAVWSDKAKTFMRHCAEKNGIRGNRLVFALEPEAVSVYFQYLHELQPTEIPEINKRYVVVDIGGGTVDITAHQKTDNGDLIELCKSTGDDIGGSEVDKNFLILFEEIVGNRVMNSLSTDDKYLDSYFDILKEIEKFKRNILASERERIFFDIPFSNLDTLCREYNSKSLSETIVSSKYSKEISLKGDHIIFLRSSLLSLFQPVGNRISSKIREVMEELKDVDMILLAGGLSMSPVIVSIIKESFCNMKIIQLPQKYPADLAVVMGAVLYGHHPHMISSRISKYTYGRLVQPKFKIEKHDLAKLVTINGIDLCKDVFETLVKKNTRVNVNDTIRKVYKGMHQSQKHIKIAVYTTKKDRVDYVDDSECELFCEVIVPLSESSSKHPSVIVDFIFGSTEFRVTAFDEETKVQYVVSVELK